MHFLHFPLLGFVGLWMVKVNPEVWMGNALHLTLSEYPLKSNIYRHAETNFSKLGFMVLRPTLRQIKVTFGINKWHHVIVQDFYRSYANKEDLDLDLFSRQSLKSIQRLTFFSIFIHLYCLYYPPTCSCKHSICVPLMSSCLNQTGFIYCDKIV